MLHGFFDNPDESNPKLAKLLGEGTLTAVARDGTSLTLQRYGAQLSDKRTSFYYSTWADHPKNAIEQLNLSTTPPDFLRSFFVENQEDIIKLQQWLLSHMSLTQFDPIYKDAVSHISKWVIRPLHHHPSIPQFYEDVLSEEEEPKTEKADTQPDHMYYKNLPLICIGDALHALPPYAGAGGNLAIEYAADLARYLNEVKSVDQFHLYELRSVEQQLIKRSAVTSEETKRRKLFIDTLRKTSPSHVNDTQSTVASSSTSFFAPSKEEEPFLTPQLLLGMPHSQESDSFLQKAKYTTIGMAAGTMFKVMKTACFFEQKVINLWKKLRTE